MDDETKELLDKVIKARDEAEKNMRIPKKYFGKDGI
jgi:hypothetical protein